ncbi:alkaline phosphatase D family protein [Rubinisphaera italica]|uniref:PhoD-like phosphatase n=1 Tax=Rubinisphaera italica TaxID=2527969 RepID=A0A5C5XNR0_9PLAN|nr:alkaline phosphatase D family protein [Rubinisphaera italica]TWT64534.1 PhoD-like phosphatase [Rubinisphaera italica]
MLKNYLIALIVFFSICSNVTLAQSNFWPDPTSNEVLPYETTGLVNGPLLGRPADDAVRLWIQTREPVEFEILYSEHLPLDGESQAVSSRTIAEAANTGIVDLAGLKSNTRYYYGVRIQNMLADLRESIDDPWPSFRTLPNSSDAKDETYNPEGVFNVRFAVGHCASQAPVESGGQYASTPAYTTLLKQHADEAMFAIVNGDIIYEAERDGTLEGVRENYELYFSRGRSFSKLFRHVPGLFTFDDHDVGWDIHGCGEIGLKEGPHLIRDIGLQGYRDFIGWANYAGPQTGSLRFGKAEMKSGSDILFDPQADFSDLDPQTVSTIHLGNFTREAKSPKRQNQAPKNSGVYGLVEVVDAQHLKITPAARVDESIPYSIGTHHYYDWQVSNCHFFALDTRGERSNRNPKNREDPSLFILGPAQEKWLIDGMQNTQAEFIFLISPDPWMVYHTAAHVNKEPGADKDDKGDGFPSFVHQREKLLDLMDQIKKPILIFTGDVHASASIKITDNVWEMMCGPLGSTGHPLGTLGNPPTGGMWSSMGRDVEMRWVAGFPNNLPYQRIRNTFYGMVQVNNVLKVASPEGNQPQWTAFDEPTVTIRWHDGYNGSLMYAETISTMDAR